MSLKVTGVYFSASSAGAGPGKMKATIRASRLNGSAPTAASAVEANANINNIVNSPLVCNKTASVVASHSQSLDYLHMNFEEKRQIIASSLSLVDFLHPPKVKGKRCSHHRSNLQTSLMNPSSAIFSFFFFFAAAAAAVIVFVVVYSSMIDLFIWFLVFSPLETGLIIWFRLSARFNLISRWLTARISVPITDSLTIEFRCCCDSIPAIYVNFFFFLSSPC